MSQNGSVPNNDRESLRKAALEYHEFPVPGKLSVTPTKQLTNQRDLALAYSPVFRIRRIGCSPRREYETPWTSPPSDRISRQRGCFQSLSTFG